MGESFKDLVVWQRAVELSLAVYRFTAGFPKDERFGLIDQMRRGAVSVASNISEGTGRSTRGEFLVFLGHARGSLCELQTQLVISARLGYGADGLRAEVEALAVGTSRMLNALYRRMKETKPVVKGR
jgi:four helix bundle protein